MASKLELKVDGTTYECSLGLGYLGEVLESLDLDITEVGARVDKNPFKYAPILIFESIKYVNPETTLTLKELIEILDSQEGLQAINKFITAFIQSLTKNVPKQEPSSETVAKKK